MTDGLTDKELEEWETRLSFLSQLSMPKEEPSQILDDLFLGNIKSATDLPLLSSLGITHILNCGGAEIGTGEAFYGSHFAYLELEAMDSEEFPLLPLYFEEALSFVQQALLESKGKVLIHCRAGINRSATIAIAVLMAMRGWDLLSTLHLVFEKRPFILTNAGFQRQLVLFASKRGLLRE